MKEREVIQSVPNLVSICVDGRREREYYGRLYHRYAREPVCFSNLIELSLKMDGLYDWIMYPQPFTRLRTFRKAEKRPVYKKEAEKVQDGKDIADHVGNKASFVVNVMCRQNATWQGSILWADKGKTQYFRSALELIKLIDSALAEEDEKESGSGQSREPE